MSQPIDDYYENNSGWKSGDRVMAFDSRLWRKNGGDSKQDLFIRPATIVEVYVEERSATNKGHRLRMLAELRFDHDPTEYRGKFLYGLTKITTHQRNSHNGSES